jgi:deoxyribose-phosphate aldolase
MTAAELARLIDHTLLKPDATRGHIEALCREAIEFRFANVCVNPAWVTLAARELKRSGIGLCAVVGFPLGATTPEVKACEARSAIAGGAREIDMVINIGALKSGERDVVLRDMEAVMASCREGSALSKVIIEAALLTADEKGVACLLAKSAGADFVKTSTGFGPGGATTADVAFIRQIVGPDMGIKAAGGIRDLAVVMAMLAAGATRIGTSAGVGIMRENEKGRTP